MHSKLARRLTCATIAVVSAFALTHNVGVVASRRHVLAGGGIALGGAALFPLVAGMRARTSPSVASSARPDRREGFGPLVTDPDGVLDLPEGFGYRIIERTGDRMDDDFIVPGLLDGMACFDGEKNSLVLMRNSEQTPADTNTSPYPSGMRPSARAFDRACLGGVTRTVVDRHELSRISSNFVVIGTERNCAGGPAPWGSHGVWLSCEETTARPGDGPYNRKHGYVFACPSDAAELIVPEPIVGYGRFRHEAVAVDPSNNIAYLTEDQPDGCLYRFVPDDPRNPFEGRLQAMVLSGRPAFETTYARVRGLSERTAVPCEWIDLRDVDRAHDDLRIDARQRGAAVFNRGEGIWFFAGAVYFTCTAGGIAEFGQVFRHVPGVNHVEGGTLELLVESNSGDSLNKPDNVTVAPWGDVILAEDKYDFEPDCLRGLTPEGHIYPFARNRLDSGELAGVCFSPDDRVMFVNIFESGATLAIVGPFPTRTT